MKERILVIALCLALAGVALPSATRANDEHGEKGEKGEKGKIKHVLLISVDGLHAVDLANYVAANPQSTLAQLSQHGLTYTNASTSTPSDSFPGLTALVTGGSPTTAGFWYDVTFNRATAPQMTGNAGVGSTGGPCPSNAGGVLEYDEGIDNDLTMLNGGGGINPAFLPRDPVTCVGILPHQYLRVNTIF